MLPYGPAMPRPPRPRPAPYRSIWDLLPSEQATRPGMVRVTGPAGELLATIDPITRRRHSPSGRLEATLTPQGFNTCPVAEHAGRPRAISLVIPPRQADHPDYGPTLHEDRDPRR